MKKLLSLLIFLISLSAFSQDPYLQESNAQARKEAIKITNRYIPELGMTGEQQLLFQQKVEEYIIHRNDIESQFNGEEKLNLLYQLQQEETADMNDILTRPQLKVYKQIKPSIQPIERVQKE